MIDGKHFVVLASAADTGIPQCLSPTQLERLDGERPNAAASGKPVFLFSRWPTDSVFPNVWHKVQNTGMGLRVKVYETELVVRVRNFVAHEWMPYEYRFAL